MLRAVRADAAETAPEPRAKQAPPPDLRYGVNGAASESIGFDRGGPAHAGLENPKVFNLE